VHRRKCEPVVYVVDASDGPVSVERDGDEVEDGRRAAEHVEGHPGVTELTSERPAARHVVDGGQRHDERRDEQVSDGQRRDQVVGDVDAQVTLHADCHHHEHVADNRRHGDQSQQH